MLAVLCVLLGMGLQNKGGVAGVDWTVFGQRFAEITPNEFHCVVFFQPPMQICILICSVRVLSTSILLATVLHRPINADAPAYTLFRRFFSALLSSLLVLCDYNPTSTL